jgi:uncharacterized RDD family membrane protein YckC
MTGEAVALEVRPASFVLRGAGAIIDWLISIAFFIAIIIAVTFLGGGLDQALVAAITVLALVLSIVVLPLTVEVLSRGRSVGKLVIGARVVRDDGGAIGFRHSLARALTGVLEIYLTFGGLAALIALLSPRSKRLGDLLAGTYSQYERISRTPPTVRPLPWQLQQWAQIADVAKLPDPLARRIAQFLAQADALTPIARAGLANELAAEVAPFVSPLPAVDAETLLVAVAAVRRDRDYAALMLERERLARIAPTLTAMPHGFPER